MCAKIGMDDVDIYTDLDNAKCGSRSANPSELFDEVHLYGELNTLEAKLEQLGSWNEKLRNENEELRKSATVKDKQIQVLKNNISSLYKTAKLEIDRKNEELANLRREYDSVVFRRISQHNQAESSHHSSQPSSSSTEISKQNNDSRRDTHRHSPLDRKYSSTPDSRHSRSDRPVSSRVDKDYPRSNSTRDHRDSQSYNSRKRKRNDSSRFKDQRSDCRR